MPAGIADEAGQRQLIEPDERGAEDTAGGLGPGARPVAGTRVTSHLPSSARPQHSTSVGNRSVGSFPDDFEVESPGIHGYAVPHRIGIRQFEIGMLAGQIRVQSAEFCLQLRRCRRRTNKPRRSEIGQCENWSIGQPGSERESRSPQATMSAKRFVNRSRRWSRIVIDRPQVRVLRVAPRASGLSSVANLNPAPEQSRELAFPDLARSIVGQRSLAIHEYDRGRCPPYLRPGPPSRRSADC